MKTFFSQNCIKLLKLDSIIVRDITLMHTRGRSKIVLYTFKNKFYVTTNNSHWNKCSTEKK